MKNLGEKLKEARNAMGYSLRDVADATRLRANVIENMESGNFDFNLPDIYKRGFLRIYAAFLKLDVDQALAEYAIESRPVSDVKHKNILSRMAAASPQYREGGEPVSIAARYEEPEEEPVDAADRAELKMQYFKLGGVFLAVLLAAVVIILIITSLVKMGEPDTNPDIALGGVPAQPVGQTAQAPQSGTVTLVATGDTYIKASYDMADPTTVIYAGPLNAANSKQFKLDKPIFITTTDAEKLKIYKNEQETDSKGLKGPKTFRISPVK